MHFSFNFIFYFRRYLHAIYQKVYANASLNEQNHSKVIHSID